jgi:hypothetical protein
MFINEHTRIYNSKVHIQWRYLNIRYFDADIKRRDP